MTKINPRRLPGETLSNQPKLELLTLKITARSIMSWLSVTRCSSLALKLMAQTSNNSRVANKLN